jgi:hypothetical protein
VIANVYWIMASWIELTAGVVLILSLFRLPITTHILKIIIYCLIMAVSHYNIFYVLELRHILLLENIILFILLFNTIVRLPVFLSSILAIIQVFFCAFIETIVSITLSNTYEITMDNKMIIGSMLLITSVLLFVATSIIQYFKIGFVFKDRYFSNKSNMKPFNYVITFILVVGLILTIYYSVETLPMYLHSAIGVLGGGSMILIGYTYYQNKKEIESQNNKFTG